MLYMLLYLTVLLLKLQNGVHGYMIDPDCGGKCDPSFSHLLIY
jgi:hypothetical protein